MHALAALVAAWPLSGSDLPGRLQLVDTDPFTTPVEHLGMALRSLDRPAVVRAQTDRTGRFNLTDMVPGRYAFDLSFPGHFVSVSLGGKPVSLPEFELKREDHGPLDITVSMKSSSLLVEVRGMPHQDGEVVALLAPADKALTLRYSCYLNQLSGLHTEFRFVPPGTYRLFIVDDALKSDVSGYAPHFPGFLKEQAPVFVITGDGRTKVTATYIDATTVQEAVRRSGPLRP
jgi:hypothetical protein